MHDELLVGAAMGTELRADVDDFWIGHGACRWLVARRSLVPLRLSLRKCFCISAENQTKQVRPINQENEGLKGAIRDLSLLLLCLR